jgi:hypothetical protein
MLAYMYMNNININTLLETLHVARVQLPEILKDRSAAKSLLSYTGMSASFDMFLLI